MAFERGVEWERPGAKATLPPPKLPSLNRIVSSIKSMNFSDQSLSVMSSGSLRSNPAFGGSGPYRGGPRLPVKHSKRRLQNLLKPLPRRGKSPRPNSSKTRKRAGWAGLETHEFRVDTSDLLDDEPEVPKETESSHETSSRSSDSDSSSLTSDSSSASWFIDEAMPRKLALLELAVALVYRFSKSVRM